MRRFLLGLLVLVALAAGLTLLFRETLAEWLLEAALAGAGFEAPEVEVVRLDWTGAELRAVRLGPDLGAEGVRVDYRLAELFDLKLRHVAIVAPRLDLGVPRPSGFGTVLRLLGGEGGGGAGPPVPLPPIEISDARLDWPGPFGPVTVRADGALPAGGSDAIKGRFTFAAEAEAGRLAGEVAVETAADGRVTVDLQVRRGDLTLAEVALEGVSAGGRLTRGPDGRLRFKGRGSLAVLGRDGRRLGAGEATIALDGGAAELDLAGDALGAPFRLAAEVGLDLGVMRIRLDRLRGDLTLTTEDGVLPALGLPPLGRGTARLSVLAHGVALPLADLPRTPHAAIRLLQVSDLEGTAVLAMPDAAVPGWAETVALVVGMDFRATGDAIEFRLPAPALAEVRGLSADLRARLADLGPLLDAPLTLTLEPTADDAALARLTEDGAAWRGGLRFEAAAGARAHAAGLAVLNAELWPAPRLRTARIDELAVRAEALTLAGRTLESARFTGSAAYDGSTWTAAGDAQAALARPAFGEASAARVSVELPIAADLASGAVTLTGPGTLRLERPRLPGVAALPNRLALRLTPGRKPFVAMTPDGLAVHFGARLAGPIAVTLNGSDGPLALSLGTAALILDATQAAPGRLRADATLKLESLSLPARDLVAQDLAFDLALELPGPSGRLKVAVASIASFDAALPRLPLSLAASAEARRGAGSFEAALAAPDGLARIEASGRFDLAAKTLQGEAALQRLPLGDLANRLRDAWAPAAAVRSAAGAVSGSASFAWRDGKLTGDAALLLEDVALATEAVSLSGISGRLALAQLWPPATDRPQLLQVKAVDGPVAFRDIVLPVELEAVAGRAIGRLRVAGGNAESDLARIAIEGGVFDPVEGRHGLELDLNGLSLTRLFQLAKIEGLAGSGSLQGGISLLYANGRLAIPPTRLVATGPGVIRFTNESARRALAAGGETVALLTQALENFQYDSLSLELVKDTGGAMTARLKLLGRNPDVLDGHPFEINIDLGADFESLLATVLEAYDLSGRALRATVK